MSKLLITGAAGFLGRHVVEYFIDHTKDDLVLLDSLTYAGNLNRITSLKNYDPKRIKFVYHNLRSPINDLVSGYLGNDIEYIYHLAANSSVEFTLLNPEITVMDNVMATVNILEYARKCEQIKRVNYFSCYDKETRAMTKEGLKYYWELKEGDVVLTLNNKRIVEENPIEKVIIQDYSGEMIFAENGQYNFCVTPNHRMYNSDMSVVGANQLLDQETYLPPKSCGYSGKNKDVIIGDNAVDTILLFYLCGVFIGDGHISHQQKTIPSKTGLSRKDYLKMAKDSKDGRFIKVEKQVETETVCNSYRIFFDVPEKDKARKRLEETLEKLKIKYRSHNGKGGEHVYFSSEHWLNFFKQFGIYAGNKNIPAWMLEYDMEHLRALYDGLIDSDGYRSQEGIDFYHTISEKLQIDIVELSIKLGYKPALHERYCISYIGDRKIEGNSLYLTITKGNRGVRTINKKEYSGKIWCITVKNKNFLVERNGRLMFSGNTDEVYGPVKKPGDGFDEEAPHKPSNPYSAGKAAGECYAHAWHVTYGLPVYITNTMNIFGYEQHPEKYIPTVIRHVKNGSELPVYSSANGKVAGSRFWIFGYDVADALLYLKDKAVPGEKYHIVGNWMDNLDLAKLIAKKIDKTLRYKMFDFHSSRPGHDLHYGLKDTKLGDMGWKLRYGISEGLDMIIPDYVKRL